MDSSILGSILRSPYFGNLPNSCHKKEAISFTTDPYDGNFKILDRNPG